MYSVEPERQAAWLGLCCLFTLAMPVGKPFAVSASRGMAMPAVISMQ